MYGRKPLVPVVRPLPVGGLSFDPVVDVYDATRSLPPPLMARVLDALVTALPDGTLLEAGVGTGRFAVPLRARGVRVVGVDIAPRMLAKAREKGAADLFLASAAHLPFRDAAFPSSAAIHMLHLVSDWRSVLREIARVTHDRFLTLLETVTTRPADGEPRAGAGPGDAYHPIRRYHEIARERGFDYEHPGIRPQDLVARAEPDVRIAAGTHAETVPADLLLSAAATKSYSSQWGVPDDVHAAVMEALTAEMAAFTFERTWEIEVVGWTPDALRAL